MSVYYKTRMGEMHVGQSENILRGKSLSKYKGKVKLIFTSPPFPLNRKKKYGNLQGSEYLIWFSSFASMFSEFISDDGSIVIELGNAWNPKLPTLSTLPIESLLKFKKEGNLHLCQEFIHYNSARLPSPIQWVNKERIRVKDAFTRIWWLAKTPRPQANNRNVLLNYSNRMKLLLKSGRYNSGRRPSEHVIGKSSFMQDNGGAIPPNVLIASNTKPNDDYLNYCRSKKIEAHPARMPESIIEFFLKFITVENDLVMDPFAGSNTTGAVAERCGRKWIGIESNEAYALGSFGRFLKKENRAKYK